MKRLSLLILASVLCAGLFAQSPKLSIAVSSDTVLLGNYFEVKFTIENTSAKGFESPQFHDIEIVGGPNTSSSMSIINGTMSQSTSLTYYLRPAEIGVYTIRPAYLNTGETSMETPPVEIIVLPNPEGIIERPHAPSKRIEEIIAPRESQPTEPARPRKKF